MQNVDQSYTLTTDGVAGIYAAMLNTCHLVGKEDV